MTRSHAGPPAMPGGGPPRPAAVAASHAATIGPDQAAAAYSRRGGHPVSHAAARATAAMSVTGVTASAIAASPSARRDFSGQRRRPR
ncbi:MAG TPA: hypothetical protein VF070_49665 [Streptosporangiaceae bacterium]